MKYIILCCILSFCFNVNAQDTKVGELEKLITVYEQKKEPSSLTKAAALIDEIEKESGTKNNLKLNVLATKVYASMLNDLELVDPIKHERVLNQTYELALTNDSKMSHRFNLLSNLYLSKSKMIALGRAAYDEEDFELAYAHYENALESNSLEMEYPRYTPRDTTILFTSAVFAKLAGKKKEALTNLEAIIEMGYDRKDAYDYLIELYEKDGNEKRAMHIKSLKLNRYPE